jgi:hypothetical protein
MNLYIVVRVPTTDPAFDDRMFVAVTISLERGSRNRGVMTPAELGDGFLMSCVRTYAKPGSLWWIVRSSEDDRDPVSLAIEFRLAESACRQHYEEQGLPLPIIAYGIAP